MVNDESKLTTLNDALNKTQSTIPLSTELSAHPTTIQMRERFEKRSSDCRIMRRIIAEDPNYNLTTNLGNKKDSFEVIGVVASIPLFE
ncbi:unnamed protein product [Trichobilharzia regenti]|nr:unnamed protein product [Trichobilharzia regenti]